MSKILKNTIPFKQVRASQPQVAVGIDWSNPITKGLRNSYVGPHLHNIANNKRLFPIVTGVVNTQVGHTGVSISTKTTSSTYDINETEDWSGDCTVLTYLCISSTTSWCSILNKRGIGNIDQFLLFQNATSNSLFFRFDGVNNACSLGITLAGDLSKPTVVVVSLSAPNNVRSYLNGVKTVTSTVSGTQTGWTGTTVLGNIGGFGVIADFFLTLRWNRVLSDKEVSEISQNPWQIFTPINKTMWAAA